MRDEKTLAHDILIVDDEADIRLLIEGILNDEGFKARQAASAEEASSTFGCKMAGWMAFRCLTRLCATTPTCQLS